MTIMTRSDKGKSKFTLQEAKALIEDIQKANQTKTVDALMKEIDSMPHDVTMGEYQHKASGTAEYPDAYKIVYPLLGLVGEVGELANKYKKVLRGDYQYADIESALVKELGDVLWYISALATDMNSKLNDVAQDNLAKLQKRAEKGMIKGSGDDRENN
jgi:NTP pyrophosphatase (non-canonical NTP hydrolase)